MAKNQVKGKKGRSGEVEFVSVRSPRQSHVGRPAPEPGRLIAFGIFALVTAVFFSSHIGGSAFLWEDFTEQYLPFQSYAAAALMSGEFPFWNPYTFGGMPFFADLQNGVFYPGHLLVYIFSGGEPSAWILQMHIILHYFIAMVGMWMLAGRLGIGAWGKIYAGIAYGLTGMMVAHMIHPNMVFHMAWFPMIAALYWGGIRDQKFVPIVGAGLITGLVMLSGHPQSALTIILFLVAATIFEIVRTARRGERPFSGRMLRTLVVAVVSMISAAGIFAVQFLPSQQLAERSQRAEMTYEASTDGSLELRQIFTLVAPDYFGVTSGDPPADLPFWLRGGGDTYYFWETVVFVGVVTLVLALVALFGASLGTTGWFLLGAGLFGLLYGLGDNFILHPLFGKLPGLSSFRIPARMGLLFALAMPLLAGAGLDRLLAGSATKMKHEALLLGSLGLLLLIAILLTAGALDGLLGVPAQLAAAVHSTALPALLFLAAGIGISVMALRSKLPALGVAIAMVLLGTIDLFTFGIEKNRAPSNPEDRLGVNSANFEAFVADPPEEIFRVQMRGTGQYSGSMLMLRNQGPYSKIMLIEGYNPLVLDRVYPRTPDYEESMRLMNARFVLGVDSATGAPLGYRERSRTYEHARLLFDAVIVEPDGVEQVLKDRSLDLSKTAVLEQDPGISLTGSGTGSAAITEYSPSAITVETDGSSPSILVLSEVYYPAWQAYVDGQSAPLIRTDWSLRGIPVPAGKHVVELRYESTPFATGLVISVVSLLLLIVGLVFLRRIDDD